MWICNDLCKALVSAGFPSRLFFSCQLGWVVVDGIPPAPSMSLCQEESTRRLGSLLQSFTGPMESHHFEKKNFVYFVRDSFGSDLLKPALHFFGIQVTQKLTVVLICKSKTPSMSTTGFALG